MGDAITTFRLGIIGKLVTDLPTPKLCVYHVASDFSSTIRTHIDSLLNEDCFSIDHVPRIQWNLDSSCRNSLLPCPLAIDNDKSITSTDVILHPDYPGLEGETRGSPSMDRTMVHVGALDCSRSKICCLCIDLKYRSYQIPP